MAAESINLENFNGSSNTSSDDKIRSSIASDIKVSSATNNVLKVETSNGHDVKVGNQEEQCFIPTVDVSSNQRTEKMVRFKTRCYRPACKTPSVASCAIVVIFIAVISTFITLSLTAKRTLVSHPLFEGCTAYPSHQQIYNTLQKLQNEFHENIKLETIGQSFEKKNLTLALLSTNLKEEKQKIWIQCGAHGRETSTPIVCLSLIYNLAILIQDKSSNTKARQKPPDRTCIFETEYWESSHNFDGALKFSINETLIDQFEFVVLPLVNPDGYEFALYEPGNIPLNFEDGDPSWRKNRNNSTNSHCKGLPKFIGVDLNRNYDVKFYLDVDDRKNPCSNGYGGEKPFSESETMAISKVLESYKGNIAGALDIHSFMGAWLYPPSYELIDTNHSLTTKKILSRMFSVTGVEYLEGSGPELTYFCTGTFMDWVYEVLGCHHAYTIELRSPMGSFDEYLVKVKKEGFYDSNAWRFFQPEFTTIQQISDETWIGLLALLEQL